MIIDFHTHTFPDKIAGKAIDKLSHTSHTVPFTDGTVSGLKKSMKMAGIDLSVILPVATSPHQVEHINDSSAALNRGSAGELISFGAMHPDCENWYDELSRIRDMGIPGIKVHPVYQDVDLNDIRFLRIFERCRDLGLIVVTHGGLDIGFPGAVRSSPEMALKVMQEIPDLRLVVAHMGGWKNWEEVPGFLAGTGVYLDTAFSSGRFYPLEDGYWDDRDTVMLNAEAFMKIVNAFGTDRILFGTDSPWSDASESLSYIRALPLGDKEREMILGGNAKRLLCI